MLSEEGREERGLVERNYRHLCRRWGLQPFEEHALVDHHSPADRERAMRLLQDLDGDLVALMGGERIPAWIRDEGSGVGCPLTFLSCSVQNVRAMLAAARLRRRLEQCDGPEDGDPPRRGVVGPSAELRLLAADCGFPQDQLEILASVWPVGSTHAPGGGFEEDTRALLELLRRIQGHAVGTWFRTPNRMLAWRTPLAAIGEDPAMVRMMYSLLTDEVLE